MGVRRAAGVPPDRLVLRALRDRPAPGGVGCRAHAYLAPEPPICGNTRRARASEPRIARHHAAKPRGHRAAGPGHRPAVSAAGRGTAITTAGPPAGGGRAHARGPPGDPESALAPARDVRSRRGAHGNRPPHDYAADAL